MAGARGRTGSRRVSLEVLALEDGFGGPFFSRELRMNLAYFGFFLSASEKGRLRFLFERKEEAV